jgi:hypothetical protein
MTEKFREGWAMAHASKTAHYFRRCPGYGLRSICGRMGRIFEIRTEEGAEQCKSCRRMMG